MGRGLFSREDDAGRDAASPDTTQGSRSARHSLWTPARPAALRATRPAPAAASPVRPASPDRDSWAPIVVGDPIFEFEPKPPPPGPFRADTVFDGWSAGPFTVRLASVRGYSHRYSGVARQDDAQVAFHPRSGAVTFAVADGVSSARYSHIGASVACQSAVGRMARHLPADRPGFDWAALLSEAVEDLEAWAAHTLGVDRAEPADVEAQFATTLIAGYVLPTPQGAVVSMIQIGDSGAWLLRRGRFYPVLAEKNNPRADLISSEVSPLPRIPAAITPVQFRLPEEAVLLVGSDGFGDPLGDGRGKVGELFAEHLASPPSGRALAHLLDFSRETFDDDRTLVALWPRSDGQGGRP
jgi:hypothetical protein